MVAAFGGLPVPARSSEACGGDPCNEYDDREDWLALRSSPGLELKLALLLRVTSLVEAIFLNMGSMWPRSKFSVRLCMS